jgi:hypothetical protein
MPLPAHITLPVWCKEFVTARAHRELRHFNLSSGFREESTMGGAPAAFGGPHGRSLFSTALDQSDTGTVVEPGRLSDGSTSILRRRTGSASALI